MPSDDAALRPSVREWVAGILADLDMVDWDRFTLGHDDEVGEIVTVYGWIDRDADDYKDFVLVRFFPDTDDSLIGFTTSSDRYTEEIHQRIFGDVDGHNSCRRVEDAFDVPNAIELGEQTELVTDGGSALLRDDRQGAVFGPDAVTGEERKYRYRLWRTWDVAKPTVAFIMLNPSTADETSNDNTIRRCIGYARSWGYGQLVVGNLFAVRAKKPKRLYDYFDPIGPENDYHLQAIADDADKVIAAWGTHGSLGDRGRRVVERLDADLYALDTTKDHQPVHPLYQPTDADPVLYEAPGGGDDV